MASRLQLQNELERILGTTNVYFQPPESLKMTYPCIRYSLSTITKVNADNKLYNKRNRYEVMLIDSDPDNVIKDSILESFDYIEMGSSFRADNLNHYPFTIYY